MKVGYGVYPLQEMELKFGRHTLRIVKESEVFRYIRESKDGRVEKVLASREGKIAVNPVEPVNLPKNVTNYLEINFKNTLLIEPGHRKTFFTTFPVEIGVFTTGKGDIELIDVFSNVNLKYSLYGDPRNGVVCRYWESELYTNLPERNPLEEGIMRISIRNNFGEWVEVSRAVFNVYLMKIYYSDEMVFSNAEMEILSKVSAETKFLMDTMRDGMRKSVEVFTPRKVPVVTKRFFMEWGV
ncbi:DUF432 domain-containing protein [Geoglobus acetivorans]|uniref:DUF432 domain-containing protein n=1 Tax=Geoglobus acetivorans TaxID=565033 RepID=A0ABZ3H628_GEOAI|nr:DUF432 domain-containing protein [Geoglobus acetivorans]